MPNAIWIYSGKAFGGPNTLGHRKTNSVSRTAALQSLGSVVYAARLADGTIKIGCTSQLEDRLRYLCAQTKQDVELLAFRLGTFDDERALHHSLAEHVEHGREFYLPNPPVLDAINEMRQALHMPPIAA